MKTMVLTILGFALALTAAAEDQAIDPNLQYLVLATHRTPTMQKEIDMAASQGFRVVAGLSGNDEIILLLERVPQPAQPYSYRLLATHRPATMEKELNEAGRAGFRFLPQTAIEKGDEVIVIMERDPKTDQRYEYQLLATRRTSTLQKELNEPGREGFSVRGTFSRDERMAVLERPSK